MSQTRNLETGSGISRALARRRRQRLSELAYQLHLSLPRDPAAAVTGSMRISLRLRGDDWPPIDFAPAADAAGCRAAVRSVRVDGAATGFELNDGHIELRQPPPSPDRHVIEIEFAAGTPGLIRRPGFAYTLFVPARAHTVLPCFDQPDLKAPLTLQLDLPTGWTALANAPLLDARTGGDRTALAFAPTEPLPTYLYAFLAGNLRHLERRLGDRELGLCVPADADPLADAQADEIFALHAGALDALERYTGIAYPFARFALALIPDFEFGGMEHPGCTLYRHDLLALPATAGIGARVHRASLIAHETAHMWFGGLVTMPWFDEVWLKEVFANFMADKIVAAGFPGIDHELGFALRHFPPALAIDRTDGTHPIRQTLDNLAEAGELYDALIYHKAPIAMAALQAQIGPRAMRRGLRAYLDRYRFANAGWAELRGCLQQATPRDLDAFSQRWIESRGPPRAGGRRARAQPVYAIVELTAAERERCLLDVSAGADARSRAAAWIAIFEDMLDGGSAPSRVLTAALALLGDVSDELLLARVRDDLADIYWRWLPPGPRAIAAGPVERALRLRYAAATAAPNPDRGSAHFWLDALARFALSQEMLAELESIWRGDDAGLGALPEPLAVRLALTLSLHQRDRSGQLIGQQIAGTQSADRRARLRFLLPAVAAEPATRDDCFNRLVAGQGPGLWAVAGARLLNHALHAETAIGYLEPGLQFAAALRQRGDIFLPRQWLTALFDGHATAAAAAAIRRYLQEQEPPPRLRQLILQTADPVFRAARFRG